MQRRSSILRIVAGALLVLELGLNGCGGGATTAGQAPVGDSSAPSGFAAASAVLAAQKADTPVSASLVAADNAFGLDLINLLNQGSSTNLAISPTSIALALQMLYNGAAGGTQQGMATALQLQGLTAPQVDTANAALQASLIDPDPDVRLTLANSLWMHLSENPVLPGFIQANQTYYGAQIGDLAGAPADVNDWIASATGALITQILPPDFNPDTVVLVIANALYFKGAWSTAFDPAQTIQAPFTRADGSEVSCPVMHQTGTYQYLQGTDVQVIRLPYGQRNRLSMVIVLPRAGVSLGAVLGTLTAAGLEQWISQSQPTLVALGLPRFTAHYSASLVPPLTTLGMGVAFSGTDADFSSLAPNTFVSSVQHATIVQVDETGTVAAGASSVGISPTVVVDPLTMTVDHPFFYAIRDDETGVLLFAGLMFDPTAG